MMTTFPESGTRLRATSSTDDWGSESESWASPDRLQMLCWLQQNVASENLAETDTTDTRALLFLPSGSDILASDRWEQDGRTYKVVGDPNRITGPLGEDHVEVTLEVFTTT